MAWNGLVLTVDGQNALNAAQLANSMNIKSVVVGDGQPPDNFRTQKGLVHQLYEITDLKVDVEGKGRCTVTVDIPYADNSAQKPFSRTAEDALSSPAACRQHD